MRDRTSQSGEAFEKVVHIFPKTGTIRYLGNKRKMIDFICTKISEKVDPGEIVIDLFAGTNCVGYALKNRNIVYTNDIQKYSYVIAKALIENNSISISKREAERDLNKNFKENLERLERLFQKPLNKEEIFFDDGISTNWTEYKYFSENSPYYSSENKEVRERKFEKLFSERYISKYRKKPKTFPYLLFSTYFSNGYFGIKQSLEIDSLRYAIEKIDDKNKKKFIYITALIYAITSAVTSTGHFAQYRNINSEENCNEIIHERSKSIRSLFYDKIEKLFNNPLFTHYPSKAFNQDYSILLNSNSQIKNNGIALIYADPPYTTDHYSRYYHVLETIVNYDYPKSYRKGRYRADRYHSNFSKPKYVILEFKTLIGCVSNLGCKLLLSYTDAGLVSSKTLIDLCKMKFKHVSFDSIDYNHSNQGRSMEECKIRKKRRKEYLIYCE